MSSYKNSPVLDKLEFTKIRTLLADECSSFLGKKRAEMCFPSTDRTQIIRWQEETAEIVSMLSVGEVIPLGGIRELNDILKKLRIHQVLEAEDFLDIERSLYAAKNLHQFFLSKKNAYHLKWMAEYGEALIPDDTLRTKINRTIREDGYVLDSASTELSNIRRNLSSLHQNIRKKMDQIVKSSALSDALQEQIVTVRGERLVVPVKVEYKSRVPGIIHDQSASGSTLYVEPSELVPMNNKVVQLEQDERHEIYQILKALSDECADAYQTLKSNMYQLGMIDFTVGKAQLAIKMDALAPHTLESTTLHLKRAYHPLLNRETAVPISLHMDDETRIIVITGPNTGGKTVTLKTVGLLVLMHQAGLHVPVHPETEMGIFDQVFVDIGDEQSIEQSLSTFSSHLVNICEIMKKLDAHSLALYDELGAGTDPGEGASLATAILEANLSRKCKALATTHYSELKTYAYQTPGVQNASMAFDVETLQPTYRLVIGVSGESNAFAIAERIGLPESIIQSAKEIQQSNQNELIDKVKNLESLQRRLNEQEAAFADERAQLEEQKLSLRQKEKELEAYREKIQREVNEEAIVLLEKARKQVLDVGEELKSIRKQDHLQASVALSDLRKELEHSLEKARPEKKRSDSPQTALNIKKIKPGDEVYLNNYHMNATVLSVNISKNTLEVQAGIIKSTVKLSEISKASKSIQHKPVSTKRSSMKVKAVRSEIDLRGMTVDEALVVTDRFIDDAYLNNLNQVHIIHGKGTGALRKAIKEKLSCSKYVKQFYYAPANEGGDGATIAILK